MKFNTKSVKWITAMTCVFLTSMSFAQEENLVPNGSFESIGKAPKRLGKIDAAEGWVSPTGVRADLFVDGKIDEIGTPLNIYGKETPKEGENYAGIVVFSHGDKVPRSYIMTKLSTPLKKGMKYCVKFNVSLAEASKYASNNIAAMFSKKYIGTDAKVSIIEDPDISHYENDYQTISARYNWTEVCGTYTAEGGEKFITIGNFVSNEDTKQERMKKDAKSGIKVAQVIAAYYYIDDVSVILMDEGKGEKCDCEATGPSEEYSAMIYQKAFIETEEMSAKEKVEMQQLYFGFGRSLLTEEGKSSLDRIAEILKENPSFKLQILGFNNVLEEEVAERNSVYSDMDNKRIGSAMKYLMEKGIEESRMIPSAKGAETPNEKEISASDNEELKQAKNRRVEFVIR